MSGPRHIVPAASDAEARPGPDQHQGTPSVPVPHPEQPPDLVCELLFNQLEHVSVVAMAAAGGVLTLLGTTFADAAHKQGVIISIVAFGLSAMAALLGQNEMVEMLVEKRPFLQKVKRYRMAAYALLGAGVGAFVMFIGDLTGG